MHPILLSLGGFSIYTYGFCIAVGFFISTLFISKTVKKDLISQDDLYSLFLWLIIAAVAGARILYVLINFGDFIKAPLSVFAIWKGGLVYYGGFITAIAYFIFFTKRKKIPFFRLLDVFAPGLALGHAFGRIGCFFAGCCYGKECSLPWAVIFKDEHTLAAANIPLHPTQLYEVFGNLIIFTVLYFYNKKEHFAGKACAFYLIMYAVLRFIVEFFRGDYRGTSFFGLSIAQNISIVLFTVGILIVYGAGRQWKKK